MEFIANTINNTTLNNILPTKVDAKKIDSVLAAIAYGDNLRCEADDLIGHSIANKLRLDLWMRYDHRVPVTIDLLERLLEHQKDNIFTKFIPDVHHAKIIWWKGYGAYIGSANHTNNGWYDNIEAGIFLTQAELVSNKLDAQLTSFFDHLRNLPNTYPISQKYIDEMVELSLLNKGIHNNAEKKRKKPSGRNPPKLSKKKRAFLDEWESTFGYLQWISNEIANYRPSWIDPTIHSSWLTDQFLHTYYYAKVYRKKPVEELFERYRKNVSSNLVSKLEWWKELSNAESNEHTTLYEYAPTIRKLLSEDNLLKLDESDLSKVLGATHATRNHVVKISAHKFGINDGRSLSRDERIPLLASLLYKQRNEKGWDIRRLLYYVLYEGNDHQIAERIFDASFDSSYSIPHYGIASIGEVVGWALPDIMPPRNGRTSKALRALGFDVAVHLT